MDLESFSSTRRRTVTRMVDPALPEKITGVELNPVTIPVSTAAAEEGLEEMRYRVREVSSSTTAEVRRCSSLYLVVRLVKMGTAMESTDSGNGRGFSGQAVPAAGSQQAGQQPGGQHLEHPRPKPPRISPDPATVYTTILTSFPGT